MISPSASHITTACSQLMTTHTAHTGPVAQVRYPKSRDRSAPPASTPIAFAYTSGTGLGLDSAAITHVYRVDPTKVAGNTLIAREAPCGRPDIKRRAAGEGVCRCSDIGEGALLAHCVFGGWGAPVPSHPPPNRKGNFAARLAR